MARDRALTEAFRALARRERSEAELRATLERSGFRARLVAGVLRRLRELGYVDDAKLAAERAARLSERGYGSLRIADELRRAGVAEPLVARAMPSAAAERARAAALLEEAGAGADPRRRAKAARFLLARGYPEEVVRSLFDEWA